MEFFKKLLNTLDRMVTTVGNSIINMVFAVTEPVMSHVRPYYRAMLGKILSPLALEIYDGVKSQGIYRNHELLVIVNAFGILSRVIESGLTAGIISFVTLIVVQEVFTVIGSIYYGCKHSEI